MLIFSEIFWLFYDDMSSIFYIFLYIHHILPFIYIFIICNLYFIIPQRINYIKNVKYVLIYRFNHRCQTPQDSSFFLKTHTKASISDKAEETSRREWLEIRFSLYLLQGYTLFALHQKSIQVTLFL